MGRVALKNLISIFGNGDDNDGGNGNGNGNGDNQGDEDDMYMNVNPPSNPALGKLWGELGSDNSLIQAWIWQNNPALNANAWMSDVKYFNFPALVNGGEARLEIDSNHNYLIKGIHISANYPSNAILSLHYGDPTNLFTDTSKIIGEVDFPDSYYYGVKFVPLSTIINTYFNNGEDAYYNNSLGFKVKQGGTESLFTATASISYQLIRK